MGLLNQNQIDKATELNYSSLKKYRNLDYNNSGLWDWEEKTAKLYFKKCKSILVGACGGGREIIALSRMGYAVEGFECSLELVRFCEEALSNHSINTKIYHCPPNQVPEDLNKYDGIIMGWGAYMHIRSSDKRIRFLKKLRQHLNDDGPLLVSFFAREQSKQYGRIYNIARLAAFLSRNTDPVELGDTLNGTFDHFFIRDEIEKELAESGFNLVHYSSEVTYPHAVAKAV